MLQVPRSVWSSGWQLEGVEAGAAAPRPAPEGDLIQDGSEWT